MWWSSKLVWRLSSHYCYNDQAALTHFIFGVSQSGPVRGMSLDLPSYKERDHFHKIAVYFILTTARCIWEWRDWLDNLELTKTASSTESLQRKTHCGDSDLPGRAWASQCRPTEQSSPSPAVRSVLSRRATLCTVDNLGGSLINGYYNTWSQWYIRQLYNLVKSLKTWECPADCVVCRGAGLARQWGVSLMSGPAATLTLTPELIISINWAPRPSLCFLLPRWLIQVNRDKLELNSKKRNIFSFVFQKYFIPKVRGYLQTSVILEQETLKLVIF